MNHDFALKLYPFYTAILVGKRKHLDTLKDALPSRTSTVCTNPTHVLAIVWLGTHPERFSTLVAKVATKGKIKIFLSAELRPRVSPSSLSGVVDAWLIHRVKNKRIFPKTVVEILSLRIFISFGKYEWMIIHSSSQDLRNLVAQALQRDGYTSRQVKMLPGLAGISLPTFPTEIEKRKRKHDIVSARRRETLVSRNTRILNRMKTIESDLGSVPETTPSHLDAITRLMSSMKRTLDIAATASSKGPQELNLLGERLTMDEKLDGVIQVQGLEELYDDIDSILDLISSSSIMITSNINSIATLENRFLSLDMYFAAAGQHLLDDLISRTTRRRSLERSPAHLFTFGAELKKINASKRLLSRCFWTIYAGGVGWTTLNGKKKDRSKLKKLIKLGPEVVFHVFPRSFNDRLGAYPLIAKCVAQQLRESRSQLDENALRHRAFEITAHLLDRHRSPMHADRRMHSLGDEKIIADEKRLVSTLTDDVTATYIMGPAYTYSLARFVRMQGGLQSYPSIVDRLSVSKEVIELTSGRLSLDIPESHWKDEIHDIVRRLKKLHVIAFCSSQEWSTLSETRRALEKGCIVDASPIKLLNALWDGVMNGSRYVNELSLLLSISRVLGLRAHFGG